MLQLILEIQVIVMNETICDRPRAKTGHVLAPRENRANLLI